MEWVDQHRLFGMKSGPTTVSGRLSAASGRRAQNLEQPAGGLLELVGRSRGTGTDDAGN
jgi:hypothetical protein